MHVCACVCMNACAAVPAPAMPPSSKAGGSRCPRANLSVYLSTGAKNKNEHNHHPLRRRAVCGRGEGPSDSSLGVLAQKTKTQTKPRTKRAPGARGRAVTGRPRSGVCLYRRRRVAVPDSSRRHMYVCVYVCVYMCVYIYTDTYIHIHVYVCMSTCVSVCIFVYVNRHRAPRGSGGGGRGSAAQLLAWRRCQTDGPP